VYIEYVFNDEDYPKAVAMMAEYWDQSQPILRLPWSMVPLFLKSSWTSPGTWADLVGKGADQYYAQM
jgi:hypothetical protein